MIVQHPAVSDVVTPLTLVIWQPAEREVILLPVPQTLKFQSSQNAEPYAFATLPRLAEVEGWSETRWLREVSLQFGVVFDGVLVTPVDQNDFTPGVLLAESRRAVWGQRLSSLGIWDSLTWWQGLKRTDALKREVVAFEPSWMTADGQLDPGTYDRFARLRLQDETIRSSEWVLRVTNLSGKAGEAGRHARMLELVGYGVRGLDTETVQGGSDLQILPASLDQSGEDHWARVRLMRLYDDWNVIEEASLEQQRVHGSVRSGTE